MSAIKALKYWTCYYFLKLTLIIEINWKVMSACSSSLNGRVIEILNCRNYVLENDQIKLPLLYDEHTEESARRHIFFYLADSEVFSRIGTFILKSLQYL